MEEHTSREPIRVFVGTDPSQMIAAKVLEFSVRKHASRMVEVVPLAGFPVPMPRDPRNRPRTPFSFARFLIPLLAGYRGRGIYLDADMIVFRDIAGLWDLPFNGASVLCTHQTRVPGGFKSGRQMSVMLLDCARLDWRVEEIVAGLDRGDYSYEQLMGELCIVPPRDISDSIPPEWNCLEHYEPGSTALLHYTDLPRQPWRNRENPLSELWLECFDQAVAAGAIRPVEVVEAMEIGHVAADLAERLADRGDGSGRTILPPELEIERLRAEVAALRSELAGVQQSWTWRIGRLLVGPAVRLRRLFR
jgi:hypothetical protein